MKKVFAYIAFIVFAAGFFLYVLFPSEAVRTYLAYRLEQIMPECGVTISDARPMLPPGLAFSGIDIKYRKNAAAILESVAVTPAYASFFKGRPGADIDASLYDGTVAGYTDFTKTEKQNTINADFNISTINLKPMPIIKTFSRYQITGILSGHVQYSGPPTGPSTGQGAGTAQFLLKKCGIEFETPVIGLSGFSFDTGETDIKLEKQKLSIDELKLNGRDLNVSATGNIILAARLSDSRISLKGMLRPAPDILAKIGAFFPQKYVRQGGIPFQVSGTFSSLNYTFR